MSFSKLFFKFELEKKTVNAMEETVSRDFLYISYITRYVWDLLAYHLQNIIFTLSVRNVYYLVV